MAQHTIATVAKSFTSLRTLMSDIAEGYRTMNETYAIINDALRQRVREIYGEELAAELGVLKTWWWKRTGKFDQVVTARLRLEGLDR